MFAIAGECAQADGAERAVAFTDSAVPQWCEIRPFKEQPRAWRYAAEGRVMLKQRWMSFMVFEARSANFEAEARAFHHARFQLTSTAEAAAAAPRSASMSVNNQT